MTEATAWQTPKASVGWSSFKMFKIGNVTKEGKEKTVVFTKKQFLKALLWSFSSCAFSVYHQGLFGGRRCCWTSYQGIEMTWGWGWCWKEVARCRLHRSNSSRASSLQTSTQYRHDPMKERSSVIWDGKMQNAPLTHSQSSTCFYRGQSVSSYENSNYTYLTTQ